ncbi:peptide/nickel transport system ATP-binding protein [Actinopolymorpha cephalotaxi]|uniref:Peptide/nickel transport system ATP-binding protein n=1 Tax=Actinopolymorpha cephalotaxi TaxID=504797 RepID=A0A1I2MYP5_9ACTN|nr:ATP-binding cassette domain-containing protein [Actinopolymorpha cephalotaxi]NYH85852.1 peptide/nickel transport system ATP-binding protein [Actinopolymorpha cephalotaxi]SFF94597.1 peptide/nickel transport system ATP-binding protein [Actinopolymorpha cephalotaxi]
MTAQDTRAEDTRGRDGRGKDIELRQVVQRFHARGSATGFLTAVHETSFALRSEPPQIVSLVGQSGSGKSTIARIILGLQAPTSGAVTYGGKDISKLSRAEYDDYRRNVQPVFQDPYAIFNPVYRVDRVLRSAIRKFGLTRSKERAGELMEESLRAVKLDPGQVLGRYPHQLSGGQRQRIMLARVHMLRPAFIIADEPVSMLDAQVRKLFLDILVDFRRDYGMSTLFITHDLSTVYYVGGDVKVITKGRVVEQGPVSEVMHTPKHPYTQLLLASVPQPDPDARWTDRIDVDQAEREEAGPELPPGDEALEARVP